MILSIQSMISAFSGDKVFQCCCVVSCVPLPRVTRHTTSSAVDRLGIDESILDLQLLRVFTTYPRVTWNYSHDGATEYF